jgi:hypothetical protein
MVPDTAAEMIIAKPAISCSITPCKMHECFCCNGDVTIGQMRLAQAGKSMAILPTDAWNPKCVQTSKHQHWWWISVGKECLPFVALLFLLAFGLSAPAAALASGLSRSSSPCR